MAPLSLPHPSPHISLKKKQGNIAVIIHHQKHNSEGGGGGGGRRWEDEGWGRETEIKTGKGIINHEK